MKHVTVVGGGFVGAIFAHHLLRESRHPVAVTVVEGRECLGAGVAYSASGPHQTTNVPVGRMSVYPDDRGHFARWCGERRQARAGEVESYPNRATFGAYMDALVRNTVPANSRSTLRHHRACVEAVEPTNDAFVIRTTDGQSWQSDAVALATGNPSPRPPAAVAALAGDPRLVVDPWAPQALAHVRPDDRILMLGAGLTMGELVAGLRTAGHRGRIVSISRRCRRPVRGVLDPPVPFGDFATQRPSTAVGLLRHFRAEVRAAEKAGLSWRSVAAAVRTEAWAVWASLPVPERRRFVRHLRPYYEALRHVMPGPVHDLLEEEQRLGQLRVSAASIEAVHPDAQGINVLLRARGACKADCVRERFDVIVNCTGPAYGSLTRTDPFWAGLVQAGLVTEDSVGLGIEVDLRGRAFDAHGHVRPDLLVLGTLARGTFGELTGVPELSRLAREAALALVAGWETNQARSSEPLFKKAVR